MYMENIFSSPSLSIMLRFQRFLFVGLILLLWFLHTPYVSAVTGGMLNSPALAWSDTLGWINFNPSLGGVTLSDTRLTGFAWSQNYGWINLQPTQGGVRNDGHGNLSGFAWGEQVGWVDFAGVSVSPQGIFSGDAHGVGIGTLTFSCPDCTVATSWVATTSPVIYQGGPIHSAPSVFVQKLPSTNSSTIRLSVVAPGAVSMKIGWDLNVLFSSWEPFENEKNLLLPTYLTTTDRITIFVQVKNQSGEISPLTLFTFDVATNDEVVATSPVSTPLQNLLPQTNAAATGLASGFNMSCQPFLQTVLPTSSPKMGQEVRKLQYFLQSFLRKTQKNFPVTGFYGSATTQAVGEFQKIFSDELIRSIGKRNATGKVDDKTRKKINDIACQARLYELIKYFHR